MPETADGAAGAIPDGEPAPRVESVLDSVVVHSSGAVCTRRARCVLPPAPPGVPVRVRLDGLPVTLFEHSLRGRVRSGPPGLRVTDARLEVGARLQRPDELPALRLDLEDAQDRQAGARERRDRLAEEIREVAAFRAVPPRPRRGEPPRWAPVESILALAGFVDSRLSVLHPRLRTAEDELRAADHDVDVMADRIARASDAVPTDRARESGSVVLTLDRPASASTGPDAAAGTGADTGREPSGEDGATGIEIEIEYQVPGAAWAPVYQLRLERATRTRGTGTAGSLVLRANVAQRTGEDWTGVRLGLSTADLMRRADLPELRSLRIGRRQAEPATQGWREPPAGLEELFTGYDTAVASRPRTRSGQRVASAGAGPVPPPPLPFTPVPFAVPAAELDVPGHLYGYGAAPAGPPPAATGAPPPPARPGAVPRSAPAARRPGGRTRRGAAAEAAMPDPAAAGGTVAGGEGHRGFVPAPAPGPSGELLDYAGLALCGPDEPGSRGRLRPASLGASPVVAEFRRRAESVTALARPPHTVDVRHSAGSFDYRFDTAAPVDVESDGAWHTVPVCEIDVETASEYVCVPSVDDAVYGTVLLTNTSGHALLAGPADVTVDGDFVLTAPLPTLAPGQRRRVGVGVVESVQVARRTHMHESTAGLRGGTTVLDHRIEVDVANRLPHPVVVEIRERVPVTGDKDVRIEERRAQPPWAPAGEPDGDVYVHGARVWRVELEPGRTATLTGGYEIRVPAGKALVGGNRRN